MSQRDLTCSRCLRTYRIDSGTVVFECPSKGCNSVIDLRQGLDRFYGMSLLDAKGHSTIITPGNINQVAGSVDSEYQRGRFYTVEEKDRHYIVIDKQKIDITDWKHTWKERFVDTVYGPFLQAVQQSKPKYSDASLTLSEEEFPLKGIQIGIWGLTSTFEEWVRQTKITVRWRMESDLEDKKFKGLISHEDYSLTRQVLEDTLIAIENFESSSKSAQRLE